MKLVRSAVYVAFGLLVLAAVAYGFWGPEKMSRRQLTDGEMAGLYGRQPAPGPDCLGCYLKTVGVECMYNDPCQCVAAEAVGVNPGPCEELSEDTYDFTLLKRERAKLETDDPNTKEVFVKLWPCFDTYPCVSGAKLGETACEDFVCNGIAVTDCRPCTRGMGKTPHYVSEDDCKTCTKK